MSSSEAEDDEGVDAPESPVPASEAAPVAPKRQKTERTSNPWTTAEDTELLDIVTQMQASAAPDTAFEDWKQVAKRMSTKRTSKQCKDRYRSKLDPSINHGPWTDDEDERLLKLAEEYPRQWSKIAKFLRGRTEHAVKSRVATLARLKIKDWTAEEDELLGSLRNQGQEFDSIALRFPSRSVHAIKKRWERLYMNVIAEKIRAKQPERVPSPQPVQPGVATAATTTTTAAAVAAPARHLSSPPLQQPAQPHLQQHQRASSLPPVSTAALSPLPAPPQRRDSGRLARHSTSMTVLLQVLGEPLPESLGQPGGLPAAMVPPRSAPQSSPLRRSGVLSGASTALPPMQASTPTDSFHSRLEAMLTSEAPAAHAEAAVDAGASGTTSPGDEGKAVLKSYFSDFLAQDSHHTGGLS